jgi:hypothetical protein
MPSRIRIPRAIFPVALTAVVWTSACGGSSTPVTPTPTPIPTPVEKPNLAPTIVSVTAGSQRIEAGSDLELAAVVQDLETPLDQLTYQWSSAPVKGEFTGSGTQVRWRAPRQQTTPDLYTIKLTVTEKYVSAGVPAQHEVSKSVDVHYNDSQSEIMRISLRFLTELFPDFSVSPQAAVQDFTDSCSEKSNELSDVSNNRSNFHILSGTYTNVSVNLNGAKSAADVSGQCTFVDIPTNPSNPLFGRRESVSGVCTLTTVYENWKWYLCSSHFRGTGIVPLNQLRYRVPGQIIAPTQ